MRQLGTGVMLKEMSGNKDSVDAFRGAMGKKITELNIGEDDALHFVFEDGTKMKLFDAGQNCCEYRYMRTDDDLKAFIGAKLLDAEISNAPDQANEYHEIHEIQFLRVKTSKGLITISNHNEHNGYYGGFAIRAANED